MIGRAFRFHGYNSLHQVYKHGRTVRGPMIAIRFMVNSKRSKFRAAVVVSRKVSRSAVTRNRIRRRLYEILRLNATKIAQPFDIVLTVYNESPAEMPPAELEKVVTQQLKQAGILSQKPSANLENHDIVSDRG